MENIEVGDAVAINKNLKGGYVIAMIKQKEKVLYHVRIIDFSTQKILGIFVYTRKQITKIPKSMIDKGWNFGSRSYGIESRMLDDLEKQFWH